MPNINHVIYDKATGRITQSGIADSDTLDAIGAVYLQVFAFDPTLSVKYYVQNGKLVPRPTLPLTVSKTDVLADGVDNVTLGGIPVGSNVSIAGPLPTNETADGTDLVLTFALPGTYTVFIQPFPYQDTQVVLHAS